jgi:hypothetical protein
MAEVWKYRKTLKIFCELELATHGLGFGLMLFAHKSIDAGQNTPET